jgi:hypothetical protein
MSPTSALSRDCSKTWRSRVTCCLTRPLAFRGGGMDGVAPRPAAPGTHGLANMMLNLPLVALAVGAFGIGVTEFAPMELPPVIAGDLGVSTGYGMLMAARLLTSMKHGAFSGVGSVVAAGWCRRTGAVAMRVASTSPRPALPARLPSPPQKP